ncbi:hypothetical protein AJ79_05178 [Helicocarpus griseus UAMH5409]|uniref:CFEM domain-containing protein n=1 Tax=Helicocarpus griseus UAMH5409 TaxID=1447875 RepID=A0A2B7XQL2_9EURO|nr:hypothetical protein AJ79_05178 [Helicocarpus griseus UAMH5409]
MGSKESPKARCSLLPVLVLLVLLCLSTLAPAQAFDGMPQCALDCITDAIKKSSCAPEDLPCICSDKTANEYVGRCVIGTCTVRESLTSQNMTMSACKVPQASQSVISPAIGGSFGSVALIMVVMRVVSRIRVRQSFGWDDIWIVLAMVRRCSSSEYDDNDLPPSKDSPMPYRRRRTAHEVTLGYGTGVESDTELVTQSPAKSQHS